MAWSYTMGDRTEETLDFNNLYIDNIAKYLFMGIPESKRSEIVREIHKAYQFVNEQLEKKVFLMADNGSELRINCRLRPLFEDNQRHIKIEGEMYLRPGIAEVRNDRITLYTKGLPETVIQQIQPGKIVDDFVSISILSGKKITHVVQQPVRILIDLEPALLEKWKDAIKGPGWP